jgi:hypothetical protein
MARTDHLWSRAGLTAGTTGTNYEPPPAPVHRPPVPSQWPMGDMSTVEKDSLGEDHRIYYTRGAELVTNVSKWLRFGQPWDTLLTEDNYRFTTEDRAWLITTEFDDIERSDPLPW